MRQAKIRGALHDAPLTASRAGVQDAGVITVALRCQVLNLTLKNVPPELHARLKASAEANRRSLNREILARLEAEMDAPSVDVEAELRALEDFVASLPRVDHDRVARYRGTGRA
jgi:uncharacterized protein YPO0396